MQLFLPTFIFVIACICVKYLVWKNKFCNKIIIIQLVATKVIIFESKQWHHRVSQTGVLQKFCWLSRDLKDQQLACIRLYSHSLQSVKWKLKGTLTNTPHIHKVLILSQQGPVTEVTITVHDCCSAHSVFQVPHFLKATHLLVTCPDKE